MELASVSVIIVNYNGAQYLPTCLDALRAQTYPAGHFEVIISDNASTDESLPILRKGYPWVKIIENGSNLGFTSGNNVAIREATGQYIILLNNDTAPGTNWLENMVKVAQSDHKAGLVTGHLQLFYDQLVLKLQSEIFVPPNDGRKLGIQVFDVDSGVLRGVVQYLAGFYGQEPHHSGRSFRWSKGLGRLGVPVPPGSGKWSLRMHLAAPRQNEQKISLKVFMGDELLADWDIPGDEPKLYQLTLPAYSRELATPLEQNTGSIVFRSGAGRDRGTTVRDFEVFYEVDNGQYSKVEEVFAGNGASLLLKRNMLEDVGLFDDDFFMYYEDTDLSWRARLRDWKVIYAPEAIVRHIHCGTSHEWSPHFTYLTERNRLAMVFKNGARRQVMRVWGGYMVKVVRMGWNAMITLFLNNPQWRQHASQLRVHLRVLGKLCLWQPSLWGKRHHIQRTKKVSPTKLESWFVEEDNASRNI